MIQRPSNSEVIKQIVMVYFILLMLSAPRLSFALCLFCGLLAALSYVRAVRESKRRHHVENLFGKQISPEVAKKMLENDGHLERRRMNVAVMFIDIRDFTRFAVSRRPEEIIQYQNDFFRIVINTVVRYKGIVHQFLGDGCMVTFGAPLHLDNPSRNAVLASVRLLQALEEARDRGELRATRIGIGIHSGEVVTGNVGTAERQHYSITGSVVILASRIEQMNKEFDSQLLVSKEVIRSAGRQRDATCLGDVSLKGWHEPVPIFKLA